MGSERTDVEEIFSKALEMGSAAERSAYLEGACGGDADLRQRVEALLQSDESAGSFLECPPVGTDSTMGVSPLSEGPGTKIGRYKLLQCIGEGGFGAVFMAEQEEPVRRKVALKIIKLGMDTKQVVARFEAERQALALMDHPNIAKVLDAGATATGRPFFVMELVKGIPITEYCDENNLPPAGRLHLFVQVCRAVQHAHQKGIIHRDIKPTNVLVTLHDSRPVPKVIDFGIAKATSRRLTEKTYFTEFRQFMGTPEYMSPEQAEMSGLDVDTRTDIYSLGVLLYELLTGTTPFDAKTFKEAGYGEIRRIIRETEPQTPSTRVDTLVQAGAIVARHRGAEPKSLSRLIRGDLDWIVMRAMEKDRTRRYETANELASDVERHLQGELVLAGPPSTIYKVQKFIHRNRVGVTAGLLVSGALVVGLGLATAGFLQARTDRDLALEAQARAVSAKARADEEVARSQAIADFLQDLLISTDPDQAFDHDVDVEKVVATAREVFGEDHATVAATLSSRSLQLQSNGDYEAAEPLQREALRIWREHHGENHQNVAVALSRLGKLLRIKGDYEAAREAYEGSLRITSTFPDEGGAPAAETLLGLADVLMNQGKYEAARPVLLDSLRLRRAHAPHQRFEIAITVNLLANALTISGRLKEAEPYIRETLDAWREALPPKSTIMAKVATQSGSYYYDQGDLVRAEELLHESVKIYGETANPSNFYRDSALGLLARIVGRRDDGSDKYVPVREEFIHYVRENTESDSALLGRILSEHSPYLTQHDLPEEGISMAIEALGISRKHPSDARLKGAAEAALTGVAWIIALEPDRPAEIYERGLRGVEMYLEDHPDAFPVINTLGVLQYRLGRYEEALRNLRRSEEHSQAEEGCCSAPDAAFIAMTLHKLGKKEEAQAALARLRELMLDPKAGGDSVNQGFLTEVEDLIGGPSVESPDP